jgi:hypothetical protein
MSDAYRAAYLDLVEEARRHPGEWQPSPHEGWKPDYFAGQCTEATLAYFRRSRLAGGLINFPDRPSELPDEWRGGLSFKERIKGAWWLWDEYRLLRSRLNAQGIRLAASDLRDDGIGRPCGYQVPGIGLVTEVAMRQAYYRHQITSRLGEQLGRVLEIGAGYGMLCAALMARGSAEQYVIVDLPENLLLEWYYLGAQFRGRVRLVSRESQLASLGSDGIVLLAPWLLPAFAARSRPMQLGINTMSFQHMMFENVAYYLRWLDALGTRQLYLVNRDFKRAPTDVEISRYPMPATFRQVARSQWAFTNFGQYEELWYERQPQPDQAPLVPA